MFKLPHICTHSTCQHNNAQNPPRYALTVHELKTSRCTSWIQKKQRNQTSNCQHHRDWIIEKAREFQKNIYFCSIDYTKAFDCVNGNKLWKTLKNTRTPDHCTSLLRNLYACQEATEQDMEQRIGSKLGKEYIKAVYCYPVYLFIFPYFFKFYFIFKLYKLYQFCQISK